MLDNPKSERIRKVAALSGRSSRKRTGLILVEGPGAVRELIRFCSGTVQDVYLTEEADSRYPDIGDEARYQGLWVHHVSMDVSRKISAENQGVVAVASAEAITSTLRGPLFPTESSSRSFWVVLPETQDPGNLGTLIRTADAMGAVGVLVGRGTCEVSNPKVIRASAGSVFHLPIIDMDFGSAIVALKEQGALVLGTALSGRSTDLQYLLREASGPLQGRHAWVFGNEAHGLSDEQMQGCDALVHISMMGEAESLNVSSAAAMCMFGSQFVAREEES